MMGLILTIVTTVNMITLDTHSIRYEPTIIETDGIVYHIEEDYSISIIEKEVK